MKVLVGFEHSGMVASAFRKAGHEAWSADIRPYSGDAPWESPKVGAQFHIEGDIWPLLKGDLSEWDLAVLHLPCTYLALSGAPWCNPKHEWRNKPGGNLFGRPRQAAVRKSAKQFHFLWNLDIPRICIENPPNVMKSYDANGNKTSDPDKGLPASQFVQPYMFGHDASKSTCFWLKNLPPLDVPDEKFWCPPNIIHWRNKDRKRWANQGPSGAYESPTGATGAKRAMERAITFPAIALEMARKWGGIEPNEAFERTYASKDNAKNFQADNNEAPVSSFLQPETGD